MLSDNCKIILLDYKSTGNVAKYCLNRAWALLFWEVKLFTLDLLQTTSASTSENMPTKRQWEIQYSMIWTPVHCSSTTFSRADVVCYKSNVNNFTSLNNKTHAIGLTFNIGSTSSGLDWCPSSLKLPQASFSKRGSLVWFVDTRNRHFRLLWK